MKAFKIIPLLFLPLFLSTTAHADSAGMTGTEILNLIEADESSKEIARIYTAGLGIGLYTGLLVSDELSEKEQMFCFPDNLNGSQINRILLKYLNEHPEEHHQHISTIMLKSYYEAFNCDKEK